MRLTTLRRIIQEITAAPDLASSLNLMVKRIREAVNTDSSAIFLMDDERSEYVLMATDGLNAGGVGRIRVPYGKGLIGLVGRREEPINLEDARTHIEFFHHPEAGEERYTAFLGVPIIHHRRLYGVLIIQQCEKRYFDESEEAFLVTISAQLATVIAQAQATGELDRMEPFASRRKKRQGDAIYKGIPSVQGIGVGQVVVVYPLADLDAVPDLEAGSPAEEIAAVHEALAAVRIDMRHLLERMASTLPQEELSLFDVYLRMLENDSLGKEIIHVIEEKNLWSQAALKKVIKRHIAQFESLDDVYLQERASDFRDLGRRVLAKLQAGQTTKQEYPPQTILVGDEVPASALAEVPEGQLAGIVSTGGSSFSHVAILARALGVPTVMGVVGMSVGKLEDEQIIVDGYYGQIYVDPTPSLLSEFQTLLAEKRELEATLDELRDEPARTTDGYLVSLLVNTGLAGDACLSLSVGAEGVGLYRTEVPFMNRDRFPVEEEQRVIYRQLLRAFAPRPVIMRTLDIGGDKALPYFPVEEDNPFLGWRGIRVTLDHPEVFLIQIRAMLRANEGIQNLRILFPMISGVNELDEALLLLDQAYNEIVEEGAKTPKPQVGVMIEVPSAVYQTRALAKRVDFVSVGTNDLTQYLLAVDRNNTRVSGLYDSLHPAVLHALIQVIEGAHSEGKPVSICGEMASDPLAVILLLAMGFDSLSMSSTSLPKIKWVIRNFTIAYARKLLGEVLVMDHASQIRTHLENSLEHLGLSSLIRAGKK